MSVLEVPSSELELRLRRTPRVVEIAIPFMLQEAFGSSASADIPLGWGVHSYVETTSAPLGRPASAREEVRQLRETARRLGRLTNQQIARGLGVDRRSLSGWISGEIRPAPERLEALRFLAGLIRDLHRSLDPAQVRDALLARHDDRDALTALAEGQFDEAAKLVRTTDGDSRAAVVVTRRQRHRDGPPLYAAALEAHLAGKLDRPSRPRTLHPSSEFESVYEIDPADARLFAEPKRQGPRRRLPR